MDVLAGAAAEAEVAESRPRRERSFDQIALAAEEEEIRAWESIHAKWTNSSVPCAAHICRVTSVNRRMVRSRQFVLGLTIRPQYQH